MVDTFLSFRGLQKKNIGVKTVFVKMSTFLFLYVFRQVISEMDKFLFLHLFHFLCSFTLTEQYKLCIWIVIMAAFLYLNTKTQDDF